jgi:4-amino-4-deoxy-L-arabinose transferase-like glycosyltransferase
MHFKYKNEHLILFLLAGTYLLMNAHFLIKYSGDPVGFDALLYKTIALTLINQGADSYDAYANITPGYPGIIALIYSIFGTNDLYVYIFQMLLGLATILLSYKIFSILTKTSFIALIFTGLLVANYSLWKFNVALLMEAVSIFLLTLSVYFLILNFYKSKSSGLYLFTVTFTLLVFINNRFIFHISILLIALFIYFIFIKKQYLVFMKICSIFIFLLLPWFVFQYNRYHQFVFFTPLWNNKINSIVGIPKKVDVFTESDKETIMFESYKPGFIDYKNEININRGKEYADKFTINDYNRIMKVYNENSKLKIYEYRLYRFFIPVQFNYALNSPNDYRLIYPSNKKRLFEGVFITTPLLLFALIGFILSVRFANLFSFLLALLFLSHILLFMFMGFVERYRYSILPVVYILACYSVFELIRYLSKYSFFSFFRKYLA